MSIKRFAKLLMTNTDQASLMMLQTGGGFQTAVNVQPAPAVWGDWCDSNPRVMYDAGPGGLVAGPPGVTVGRFAWVSSLFLDGDSSPSAVSNGQINGGAPTGFVHREQQGLNTIYLADASMLIPQGFGVTLTTYGGVWAKNEGTTQALVGQTAYANLSNGAVAFAAAGSPPAGASVTSGSIGPQAATFTGSILGNQLTVTALATGTLQVGGTVTGTGGGGVAAGTQITGQLSGTPGGVGVYSVNIPEQNVTSTSMSLAYGLLTITTLASGTLSIGETVTGTGGGGVAAGTAITALGTGLGGTGTYIVNISQTTGATSMSVTGWIATKWVAQSQGLAGELIKMTTWLTG